MTSLLSVCHGVELIEQFDNHYFTTYSCSNPDCCHAHIVRKAQTQEDTPLR